MNCEVYKIPNLGRRAVWIGLAIGHRKLHDTYIQSPQVWKMKELGEEESSGCASRYVWQCASQYSLLAGHKSELHRHLDLVFKCRCVLLFALYKWCLFLLLLFSDDLMWNKGKQEIECFDLEKMVCCAFMLWEGCNSSELSNISQWHWLGLLYCRQILYHLSHKGSPMKSPFFFTIILAKDIASMVSETQVHFFFLDYNCFTMLC